MTIRRAEGRSRRSTSRLPISHTLGVAFGKARNKFVDEHGREPNYDFVIFQGGFTTTECIVELIEEVPNEQ